MTSGSFEAPGSMTEDGVDRIMSLIGALLEPRLLTSGTVGTNLPDDLDLRDEGIGDSLGFVRLVADLETRLGCSIDLTHLDPEFLTNVGAWARHIAGRHFSS